MADNFFLWSATDSSNTSIDGMSVNTGMSPANVDNVFRKIMAACKNTFASALQTFLAGTDPLPIANGGTAATSAAAALTSLGALSSAYRDLPLTTKAAAFTFADSERGGRIRYTGAAAAATINPNATTAITDGAVYWVRNMGSGALTITRGSGVSLKQNGSATSADAILAVGGIASLVRDGTDDWIVTGSGLS